MKTFLALFLLLFAACEQPQGVTLPEPSEPIIPVFEPVEPTPRTTQETEVSIIRFAFAPQTVRIAAGDSVRWLNEDTTSHSIKFQGSPPGEIMAPGEAFSMDFRDPGIYDYSCGIHATMKGTVIVE